MSGTPRKRHSVTQPLNESYRYIPLTRGKNAIVDAADFEWLSQWNWSCYWNNKTKTFYASRCGRSKDGEKHVSYSMHRQILGLKIGDPLHGDHRNHNTLDNRRENLRKCFPSQNGMNRVKHAVSSCGFKKGATWEKDRNKWLAQIQVRGKNIKIGRFDKLQDALKAYDEAAEKYHGEFAYLNFQTHALS